MADLTRDALLALPAGPELDALVSSMLAGTKIDRCTVLYSSDMRAAWTVAQHLSERGWLFLIGNRVGRSFTEWEVHIACTVVRASTAPLALCRAALLTTLEERADG